MKNVPQPTRVLGRVRWGKGKGQLFQPLAIPYPWPGVEGILTISQGFSYIILLHLGLYQEGTNITSPIYSTLSFYQPGPADFCNI